MENTFIIEKADYESELVFGWLVVSKARDADGNLVEKVDSQDEHIPEDVIFKAARDFMKGDRIVLDTHDGLPIGSVIFAYPEIEEVIKAEGRDMDSVERTGLKVAVELLPEYLDKYKNGEYNSFSVGGINPVLEDM